MLLLTVALFELTVRNEILKQSKNFQIEKIQCKSREKKSEFIFVLEDSGSGTFSFQGSPCASAG